MFIKIVNGKLKKRNYIESLNNYKELNNCYYNYYNEIETINHKLFALNIKENIYINLDEFSTYLYAKIFTKYNDILDSFLIYMKKRKKLSKSKTTSITNTKEKNYNEKNNEIIFKFNNKKIIIIKILTITLIILIKIP